MENIQLAILLRKYEALLDEAIATAEAMLPDETKQQRMRLVLFGDGKYFACPALDDLRALSATLGKDAELLERVALAPISTTSGVRR